MKEKLRLDAALVERGLATGRDRAKALIMAGRVYVGGEKAAKPGDQIAPDAAIEVRGEDMPYVSRGGLKLEKAVKEFDLPLENAVCADIGASTGGFTDCMLQHGAARVYAVDVGYGQLDWRLRSDERVVVLERTNARYLSNAQIPQPLDLITIDASFISLALLLPPLCLLLKEGGHMLCLVKPQFEAGREKVGKNGVVRDPATHREVLRRVADTAAAIGFAVAGLSFSPIKGPKGNIEYLLYLVKGENGGSPSESVIEKTVEEAHSRLAAKC